MILSGYQTQFPSWSTVILKPGCVSAALGELMRNPEAQARPRVTELSPLYFCRLPGDLDAHLGSRTTALQACDPVHLLCCRSYLGFL